MAKAIEFDQARIAPGGAELKLTLKQQRLMETMSKVTARRYICWRPSE